MGGGVVIDFSVFYTKKPLKPVKCLPWIRSNLQQLQNTRSRTAKWCFGGRIIQMNCRCKFSLNRLSDWMTSWVINTLWGKKGRKHALPSEILRKWPQQFHKNYKYLTKKRFPPPFVSHVTVRLMFVMEIIRLFKWNAKPCFDENKFWVTIYLVWWSQCGFMFTYDLQFCVKVIILCF